MWFYVNTKIDINVIHTVQWLKQQCDLWGKRGQDLRSGRNSSSVQINQKLKKLRSKELGVDLELHWLPKPWFNFQSTAPSTDKFHLHPFYTAVYLPTCISMFTNLYFTETKYEVQKNFSLNFCSWRHTHAQRKSRTQQFKLVVHNSKTYQYYSVTQPIFLNHSAQTPVFHNTVSYV